jgi:hypothetical protein
VFAITRNNVIVGTQRRNRADADGLLPDVQMAKATDFAQAVRLGALSLRSAGSRASDEKSLRAYRDLH